MNRKNNRGEIDNNTNAGVAIVIDNELLNYITDIEPVNDRIMSITLGYVMPITFISVYSPTATKNYTLEDKQTHYNNVRKTFSKHKANGPTYIMGDFNARVQKKLNASETSIGNHTFDKYGDRIGERALDYPTRENREIFIGFCNEILCRAYEIGRA